MAAWVDSAAMECRSEAVGRTWAVGQAWAVACVVLAEAAYKVDVNADGHESTGVGRHTAELLIGRGAVIGS